MPNSSKSQFSQVFYEALVENAPELVAVINADGTITYQSGSTERVLGYGPDALIGRNVSELIHPDDLGEAQAAIQKIAADPNALETMELRFLCGNGLWLMLRATSWKLPASSRVDGIVVNAQAVTEQKAANAALGIGEARYRELTEATSDWIWAVDENLIFTYNNQKSESILGYAPDEMLGRRPFDFMSPEEAERVREDIRPAVSSQAAFENIEVMQLHKDGREIDLEVSAVPIIEEDGAFRGYRGIARDVTARKVAEEELHHTNRLLRILRACNSALIREIDEDKLLASICRLIVAEGDMISLDGTYPLAIVVFVGNGAGKTFEIVTAEGPGAGFVEDLNRAWDGARTEQGPIERVLASGEPEIIRSIENEASFVPWAKRAAEYGLASMGAFPLSDDEQVFGVIVVFADKAQAFDHDEVSLLTGLANDLVYGVTTIRDRARRVAAETRELKFEEQLHQAQKMEAVGQLTGGIAHDFNNLRMVIMGNLERLEESLGDDEQRLKWARAAHRAGARGAELTDRLLTFSRRRVLEPLLLDLNEVVRDMADLFSRTLGENTELHYRLSEHPMLARLDRGQLENALLNLAVNARDAMPAGGQLTIETVETELDAAYAARHTYVVPGDYVMVAVTDSGTGMTPETAAQVFEPFFTTKETGQGTGLGLSMVYGFTKQSGGHVNIYIEPGLGTTVKLYFPRVEPPAEGGSGHRSENTERPKGNERILVVEDDADVRDALAGMLELLGYSAVMARDGAEALRRLEEHDDFALLLTDVVMPGGMSGPKLAEEVAARRPGIKVLFTSGYAAKALRRREDSLTGANWLAEPYTINHLARRLRDVLDEENGT